jgi:radical SAM protein with 4Fe4S-binding SPASM domain
MLNIDLFKKVIDELGDTLMWLTFYFQGEPFLHPQFLEMVEYAASKNIYTTTSTNAHYLTPEVCRQIVKSRLDRLIISMDGTTQDVYESYRVGGKLSKVIEGTRNMVQWKQQLTSRYPHISFQFLVVRHNEHQIPEVRELAKALGVDELTFKTAQIYNYKNGSPLIPDSKKYSRYEKNRDGSYSIKNNLLNHCWKMWNSCVITWDGKVVPCCFDKDAAHVLGDVSRESFQSIWESEGYQLFRATLMKSRSAIAMCTNCTEGTKVWV